MNRIDFQNGSQIQMIETNHDESQDEVINIWSADDRPVRIYRENNLSIQVAKQCTKEEADMRILFVSPEKYDAVCSWYDNLDTVQKHRKVIVICKSPDEFREKFDYSKMNAQYTMFYFDEHLGLAKSFEYCKLFTKLYGEVDVRYICGNKMRQINIDDLMHRNTFDWFKEFSVVPECLEDIIRDNKKSFMCRSLL